MPCQILSKPAALANEGGYSMEVWVSGAGCLSAAGQTLEDNWKRLASGGGPLPAPPERLLNLASELNLGEMSHPAFSLDDEIFSGGFRHSARDTLVLAEKAAREALAQAGVKRKMMADGRSGLIIGSTTGNALHFLSDYWALKGGQVLGGRGFADFFNCNPAEALAEKWGLGGLSLTIGNACCSGADALGLGLEMISSGRMDRVLAGGADALSLVPYIGFRRLMIYSDEPCRPFDGQRKGLNLGEGAGMLLLESAASAEKRGARPLARFLAYGAASDAHHLTAPHPEALGLKKAIRTALARSGLASADMAFINAHGTATPDNDRVEAQAVREELPGTVLWATKGSTGHTLGAAGAIEAALTVAALQQGLVPSSQGFAEADTELELKPTESPVAIDGKAAISLSLGFGGGNAAVIFGRV